MRHLSGAAALSLLVIATSVLPAQQPPATPQSTQPEPLRLFLDCQTFFCDFDYFRREIAFVNWVRDRQGAELQVLVTAQRTGGGGWEFTLAFIGLARFTGRGDTLQHVSRQSDTQDEIRAALGRTLKLELMRYVAGSPVAERIAISYLPPRAASLAGPVRDRWNYWVFTTRVGGDFNGE